jgi:hypothetical protein
VTADYGAAQQWSHGHDLVYIVIVTSVSLILVNVTSALGLRENLDSGDRGRGRAMESEELAGRCFTEFFNFLESFTHCKH